MGEHLDIWNASASQINLYYIFVILSFLYFIYKYSKQPFLIYIVLIFYTGLFSYLGKNIHDLYKILIALLSLYWLYKKNPKILTKETRFVCFSFILFSFSYLIASFINNDHLVLTISQYSRYFVFYILFFLLIKHQHDRIFKFKLDRLLLKILFVQIFLSFIKILIMGGPRESLVGTITSQGGAAATILPLLGFAFFWMLKEGNFKRKDWYFILGLVLIGYAGSKRAIWFIMPAIISAFIFYVPKRAIPPKYMLQSIILIPLIFYCGIKLTPALNPEHKIWGSFDIQYTLDYVEYYSFDDKAEGSNATRGRGSASMLVFNKLINHDTDLNDWLGNGLTLMVTSSYEEFREMGFDITHKGSATGVYQTLISNGYIGVFSFLFFAISLILFTKNKRIRNVLLALFLWEYLFYTGTLLREYSLAFLFIYIVVFTTHRSINLIQPKI